MFERDWTGLEWDTMYALGSTPLRQIHLRRDKRRKHTIESLCVFVMSIPVMQEVGSTALKRASKDLRGNLTFMLAVAANCHPSEVVWYLAAVHLYFFIFFQVTHTHTHARTHARCKNTS